ncbi:S24/S26 family peptidase [uncultured Alistipes sp.]|jgi:hypothetical protein|uniref:S24/S26 family peptidase n=1 Tax=uncultured Alistipes sp. TaxID=538949 RepID=UPI0025F8B4C3|nr:S24/S26 family peptidase [uncultured Alistipes sp.]
MKLADNKTMFAVAQELLAEGQNVKIRVNGQSMLPFFRSGSVVQIRPIAPGDLVRGNVVLGKTDTGTYVIHRILRVDSITVTLLGDGNYIGTETIPIDRIYGIIDCGKVHLALARAWMRMRTLRRYPLRILRKVCRK